MPGSRSESYGFNAVDKLVVGTAYYVSLRIQTVGYTSCSIYNRNGCSWNEPTDYTYQWKFVYNGAIWSEGAPYYSPVATSIGASGSWKKGKKSATATTSISVTPSCLCAGRTFVLEGLLRGHWKQLKLIPEIGTFKAKLPYKYKKIRFTAPAFSYTKTDGGLVEYPAAISDSVKVPKKPKKPIRRN